MSENIRKYGDYIQDMLDAIVKIQAKTESITKEELDNHDDLSLIIERLFEILGEAANRIPKELQDKFPTIPWSSIIGMRNIIIHSYDKVDTTYLWNAIKWKLSDLKINLLDVLNKIDKTTD